MKKQKIIFIQLVLITMILACTWLQGSKPFWEEKPTEDPYTIPQKAKLFSMGVEPVSGNGPFTAILYYVAGNEVSTVTCWYTKKDDPNFLSKMIGEITLKPGASLQTQRIDFTEKQPGQYLAYCLSGEQRLDTGFAVVSPYAGEYECKDCFSQFWATDVYMVPDPPRSMGANQARITINEIGNVVSGYIFYEVYGTPSAQFTCGIIRAASEANSPSGTIDHDTKVLIVGFLENKETREKGGVGGSGQCPPPETFESGAIQYFFQANEDGNLLLCLPFETGQVCMDKPIAVLLKKQ